MCDDGGVEGLVDRSGALADRERVAVLEAHARREEPLQSALLDCDHVVLSGALLSEPHLCGGRAHRAGAKEQCGRARWFVGSARKRSIRECDGARRGALSCAARRRRTRSRTLYTNVKYVRGSESNCEHDSRKM